MRFGKGWFIYLLVFSFSFSFFSLHAQTGTIEIWGDPLYGLDELPEGDEFIAIASGDFHAIALKADGSLVGWGAGTTNTGTFPHYGQSIVPAGNDFIAIAAGDLHSLALREDGSLISWGRNNYGQTNAPAGDFVAIACGGMHSLAIREDGTIAAWGAGSSNTGMYPHFGQSIDPVGNDYVGVAAGLAHSIALRSDGTLLGWGRNNYGQTAVPDGNDFVKVSANNYHNLVIRDDGSLTAWGRNNSGQIDVPQFSTFMDITAGKEHSLAIKDDGSLMAWGMNSWGQCDVPDGFHYTAIAAGYQHSLALKESQYLLVSPNGGEVWQSGTEKVIRWIFQGNNTPLYLQFSQDNGDNWIDIAAVSSLTNAYSWLVPFVQSDQCRIRGLFYIDDDEYIIASESNFSITSDDVPQITILEPNFEDVRWQVGRTYEIEWESSGVQTVDVLFSTNNGQSWSSIAAEIPAAEGSLEWTIPNTPTNYGRIMIKDSDDDLISDISSEPFSIVRLNLLTDMEGLQLTGGDFLEISMTAVNTDQLVLSYSLDDGQEWILIASSITQTGYNWLIPNVNSSEARIRVEDYHNSDLYDVSGQFAINSMISLLTPGGDENLRIGHLYQIEWIADPSVENIVIDYTIDNGATWLPIRIIPYPADAGTYEWLIPDNPSSQCLVRVKNHQNHNSFGISSSLFTISDKHIVLTQPNEDMTWYPEEYEQLVWTHENFETINIALSYDNGVSWIVIEEGIDADSSPYSLEVPKIGTNSGKLKIYDPQNEMINSVSEGLITIIYYNPPANLTAEVTNEGVELFWDEPIPYNSTRSSFSAKNMRDNSRFSPLLLGYNVYLQGEQRNDELIVETSYLETDPIMGIPNVFHVTAVYDEEESDPSNSVEVLFYSTEDIVAEPQLTTLSGNYPNPFNPQTTISFSLAKSEQVSIEIFNIKGQKVKTVLDQLLTDGQHEVVWDGKNQYGKSVSSGVYFYRMHTADYQAMKKMIMIK